MFRLLFPSARIAHREGELVRQVGADSRLPAESCDLGYQCRLLWAGAKRGFYLKSNDCILYNFTKLVSASLVLKPRALGSACDRFRIELRSGMPCEKPRVLTPYLSARGSDRHRTTPFTYFPHYVVFDRRLAARPPPSRVAEPEDTVNYRRSR
jgi:hypothetical protein